MLHRLHDEDAYNRIVLVGHSLGSVIGLDLLRFAWDVLRHPDPGQRVPQPEAKAFDELSVSLEHDVDAFQQAQHRLWRENRSAGVRWLVTDFVTLGSPLAHASLLLDSRSVKLHERQTEREYPRCPPVLDDDTSFYLQQHELNGRPWSLRVEHHGAPFGPTRWSNLYFPVRFASLGDPVGGPVAPEFGPGVRDIPVRLSLKGWRAVRCRLLVLPHTRYWSVDPERPSASSKRREQQDQATHTKDANVMLRSVLGLDILTGKSRYPAPPPRRTTSQ